MPLAMFGDSDFVVPHPPISLACFLVVEEAICAAWEVLRVNPPTGFDIADANETEVNHQLHETLEDKIWRRDIVDGFNDELIRTICRPEVRNYNGEHPDKRPDIVIKLVDIPEHVRPSQYGIFIECKPMDKDHSMVTHYCDRGISRFVSGDYAWAMTQAMMIGYVDSDAEPKARLQAALTTRQASVLPMGEPTNCALSEAALPVCITWHRRAFSYVENGQPAPPIMLRHLWLRRN
jgi:hypothetical protein